MKISKYIGDLLFEYECIVIPDFGGFITKELPAKINIVQNHFSPPAKEIVFNVHLKTNDGLLVNHIARSEKISYADARLAVERFVNRCHEELENGKRIGFQKVGKVFADDEGNLQFEPDTTQNYYADSFGLKSFISPPIKRGNIRPLNVKRPQNRKSQATKEEKASNKKSKKVKNKDFDKPKYIKINVSAILIVFAICAFAYFKFGTITDYYNNYSSFVPFFSSPNDFVAMNMDKLPINKMVELDNKLSPNKAAIEKEEKEPYADALGTKEIENNKENSTIEDLPIQKDLEAKIKDVEGQKEVTVKESEPTIDKVDEKSKKPPRQRLILSDDDADNIEQAISKPALAVVKPSNGSFFIIAGSFSNELNAKNKVKELNSRGYKAGIAGQNKYGSYRVFFNNYTNINEANRQLALIRKEENASAWMLTI